MKKRILTVFALMAMVTVAAFAQGFGVRAGFGMQNITGENGGDDLDNSLKPAFNAGVFYEIAVAQDFYFQPNLLFNMKGAKHSESGVDLNYSIGYLELPLHFMYKPQLGTGKIIVGFGPYLAYGLTGKLKAESGNLEYDIDIKFKNDLSDDELMEMATLDAYYTKGFDAGADVFFGYEFPFKLSVQFNAQLGLLNMQPKVDGEVPDDTSFKNVGFGLSAGYRF
ncbi:MAG: PorT family protein [Bacteroidales bacterium]|nr:PorT family protein [Bacteroidales bacterium]